MMDISIPYYEDRSRISNSNIGWFLNKGPAFLHKMLTEPPPEESTTAMERGTMIHEYLLQPEEFQKDYVVWNKSRPSSAQQEKFCQELAFSTEIEPNRAILSAYKEAYSTRAKSDDLMLSEGLKIASTLKDYIDFLRSNDQRKMIGPWDVKMLEKIKQNVNEHKFAKGLLNDPGADHEFHINWEYYLTEDLNGKKVDCKSLLDSLTLNFETKTATIMDIKTTQKLWHFEDSVEMYDYLRQLMYYTHAAQWYLASEKEEDPGDWTFEYYILAIDTTGSYDVRVFGIEPDTVKTKMPIIQQALTDIAWHLDKNKWEHSRGYYEGDGLESLNL